MATITFDSLKLSDKLKASGFTAEQAEAVVRVISEAQDDLVTKKDLDVALSPLKIDLAVLKTEVTQIKWMLGLVIGGIIAVLAKLLSY
jgi:UDP-N-acetyl-D-mannosaminuronate dehydrogenase